jgi:hypothetical protein
VNRRPQKFTWLREVGLSRSQALRKTATKPFCLAERASLIRIRLHDSWFRRVLGTSHTESKNTDFRLISAAPTVLCLQRSGHALTPRPSKPGVPVMNDVVVLGFPRSTFVHIVRLVLMYKDVPFTFRDLEPEMGSAAWMSLFFATFHAYVVFGLARLSSVILRARL